VQVANLGASSVDLDLFAFARNPDYGEARSRVIEAIRDRFRDNGIDIPYPRSDLHVFNAVAGAGAPAEVTAGSAAAKPG